MSRTFSAVIGAALASVLLLSGCAAADSHPGDADNTNPQVPSAETSEAPQAATQEETCDWDSARLPSGSAGSVPSAAGADLAVALIGSWQHTHIDSGQGFEDVAPTTDIRYVFPSASTLLYCQDVEGATSQAENAAAITIDGEDILLPAPASGYTATAWTADTMVWTNNRDGSIYLLKRR